MTGNFTRVFTSGKPVITMVHFDALSGTPLHDADAGLGGPLTRVHKNLKALQDAGVDA